MLMFAVPIATAASNSFQEHFDIVWIIASAAIVVVCWFLVRTLKKIDANQADLFHRMSAVEIHQARLEGEHEATCGRMIKLLDNLSDKINN